MTVGMKDQTRVRDRYLDSVIAKVLGPGSENITEDRQHEVISEAPKNRYVTGVLFPVKNSFSKDVHQDDVETQSQDGFDPEDEPVVVDNGFNPSSMGLTFYCKGVTSVQVRVSGAKYVEVNNPKICIPQSLISDFKSSILGEGGLSDILEFDEDDRTFCYLGGFASDPMRFQTRVSEFLKQTKKEGERYEDNPVRFLIQKLKDINFVSSSKGKSVKTGFKSSYQREPFTANITVDLTKPRDNQQLHTESESLDLRLHSHIAKIKDTNIVSPTLVLQNCSKIPYFQCEISVAAQPGMVFMASEDTSFPNVDNLQEEDARLLFSYQKRKSYASGHGVSATWYPLEGQPQEIRTSYVPVFDILPMSFTIGEMNESVLRPDSYLTDVESKRQISYLTEFINLYDTWIDNKFKMIPQYTRRNARFQKFAEDNLNRCRECSNRMRKSVQELTDDPVLLKAFDLANESILLQRIDDRELKVSTFRERSYSSLKTGNGRYIFTWRPFQLAFILTTLTSVVDPDDQYRSDMDLIWVSTGGGKTEAYLCCIAISILYQRLLDPKALGVDVIMRYTLRLLTAQQFERASAIICALEFLRQQPGMGLGDNIISIGLWVGGKATPNNAEKAKEALNDMAKPKLLESNHFQLLRCPWCREPYSLVPRDEEKERINSWGYSSATRKNVPWDMKCMNPACEFHTGLPVFVVDDQIYESQPTLLFGTVDKFAQVPLKQDASRLFKALNGDKQYQPNLIIQDELHLISGPLGSIVGLYEAGFDYILQQNGNLPKYLGSTATIRNSQDQISNLYNRRVHQFPPDGLEADDNFFVKTISKDEIGSSEGRRYVGIMGTGKTQVTSEVRLFGALLASISELGFSEAEEDLFWTVVGYFNSIRELGKASTLLVDDVQDEIQRIARRNGHSVRHLNNNVELTSRVSTGMITQTLDDLSVPHTGSSGAVDTLIATNMLSVGIDVARLNAMVVVGQPKLSSEYIQATSRVGRATLGLVFSLYNSTRSRDRSHYETFTSFHQSMYRYVEPSSVTPFSAPALEKALPAIIVAMMRFTVSDLLADDAAVNILEHTDQLGAASDFLMGRVKSNDVQTDTKGRNVSLYTDTAQSLINYTTDDWQTLAQDVREAGNEKLKYYLSGYTSRKSDERYLLISFNQEQDDDRERVAMNSMRDIEEKSALELVPKDGR